jgi:hypothetical protein
MMGVHAFGVIRPWERWCRKLAVLAMLQVASAAWSQPPTCLDPTRTVFAGGPGTEACRQFDGDETACNNAFHQSQVGPASCFFQNGQCFGCGPRNEGLQCTNTCVPPPQCANPARTIFTGGPGSGACRQLDGDAQACGQAFHRDAQGQFASCFVSYSCQPCGGSRPDLTAGAESQDAAVNGKRQACTNTCQPTPPCLDEQRTVFAGGPGTRACRQFDGDQAKCEQAYHLGARGVATCFYDANNDSCLGCGPSNENQGACTNTCVPPPSCAEDPGRTIYAGGPGTEACRQFNSDQTSCEQAFHRGGNGIASCFYTENDTCQGCGPNNERNGQCINTCDPPTCAKDPSRTIFAGGPGTEACTQFNGDQTSCEQAFHRGANGIASCFYTANDTCQGCGPNNERNGQCINSCDPPTCAEDSSRTIFAGGPGTSACQQFDGDKASCEKAFHRGDDDYISSCFYNNSNNSCRGCGPSNQNEGRCTNTCAPPPTCLDEARTTFASCEQFGTDVAACAHAFQLQQGGTTVSCVAEAECLGCGPNNEAQGLCTNDCVAAPVFTTPTTSYSGLLAVTLGLLGMAFYRLYRRPKASGSPGR